MTRELLVYPYPLDLRWNHVQWYPVLFRRFLNSRFGLTSSLEVRGAAFTLFALAMDQSPPATLPLETKTIRLLLRVSEEEWAGLLSADPSPLDGWREIDCGGVERLTHPVLLEALEIAVAGHKLRQRGTRRREPFTPPDAGRAPGR